MGLRSFKKTGITIGAVAAVSGGFMFGARSEKQLATLCPAPQQLAQCMIKKSPYDFAIIQAYRSPQYQKELYQIGRRGVANEKPVTWTLKSRHMEGKAFDILVYLPNGEHSWQPEYYKEINQKAAKPCSAELNIPYVWGGTFKNSKGKLVGDWGHFEALSCIVQKGKVNI